MVISVQGACVASHKPSRLVSNHRWNKTGYSWPLPKGDNKRNMPPAACKARRARLLLAQRGRRAPRRLRAVGRSSCPRLVSRPTTAATAPRDTSTSPWQPRLCFLSATPQHTGVLRLPHFVKSLSFLSPNLPPFSLHPGVILQPQDHPISLSGTAASLSFFAISLSCYGILPIAGTPLPQRSV